MTDSSPKIFRSSWDALSPCTTAKNLLQLSPHILGSIFGSEAAQVRDGGDWDGRGVAMEIIRVILSSVIVFFLFVLLPAYVQINKPDITYGKSVYLSAYRFFFQNCHCLAYMRVHLCIQKLRKCAHLMSDIKRFSLRQPITVREHATQEAGCFPQQQQ